MKRLSLALVGVALLLVLHTSADDKSSDLQFTVIKAENGKPVRNASVILHAVEKDGKQSSGGLQLKTDADGKAELRGVSYGKLRVQVIAKGMQTYGEDLEINQPQQEFVIKLHRPQEQYSIYK